MHPSSLSLNSDPLGLSVICTATLHTVDTYTGNMPDGLFMYPLRVCRALVAGSSRCAIPVLFKYMYLYKDSVVFPFKQISVWDLFQDGNLFFFRSAYSSESPPIGSKKHTQAVVGQSSEQFRKNNNKIFLNLSFVGPDICFLFFPFTDYSSTSFPQYIGTYL